MPETEVGGPRAPRLTRSSYATTTARRWASDHASDMLISTLVIAVVSAPLVGRSRESLDFANALWMAWVAGKGSIAAGHPVLFTNTGADGPFYPLFAFYGGTLFVVTGLLGQLFGGQMLATYIGVWVLGIASVYFGVLSLARQVGVRGLMAHAPAVCAVTGAYYITLIYARGDFPEFVAVSSIPPLAASALHLVRAPRWRPLPVLVFAVSAVIFTGSHNLTLIWGITFGAVALLTLWLANGRPGGLPYRRFAAIVGLGVAAMCVNGWFLATDLLHARDVALGTYTTTQGGVSAIFDSLGVLLNPFRYLPNSLGGSPSYLRAFYVNAPMWFLAWGLVGGAIALWRGGAPARLRRAWLGAVFLVVLVIFVIANPWWTSVPFPWDETQFPYRINSYLIFASAGLVCAAALALQRADPGKVGPRTVAAFKASLVAVAAISIALCVWQQWSTNTRISYYVDPGPELVSVNTVPASWYAAQDYGDASAPIANVAQGRIMWIPWNNVRGDYFSGWVSTPPGPTPIETDIFGGDYVVQIEGVEQIGRISTGQAVVARLPGADESGPVHIVVRTESSRSIVFGRILSVLGIAVLLAVLGYTLVGPRLRGLRRFGGRGARTTRVAGDR